MGLGILSNSSSSYDKNDKCSYCCKIAYNDGTTIINSNLNPNPKNYILIKTKIIGKFLIIKICYPNCTNYEGKKILVYEDVTMDQLNKQAGEVGIDPHFSENKKYHSPIARFVPTKQGWRYAIEFCKNIK